MYKTVRKGDASLQYTILPQTDQFSSSGFPQTSGKSSPRIIKYIMGTLIILIILSCVATPFLMTQNDQSLFASTVHAMGRVWHDTMTRNSTRSQVKDVGLNKNKSRLPVTSAASSTEAYRKQDAEDEMTTLSAMLKGDEQGSEDFTTMDSAVSSTQRLQTSTESSPTVRQTSIPTTKSLPTLAATSPEILTSTPNEATKASSSAPTRKSKMPRVTLRLRQNETIPQMYVKSGIASYKKGNITTSVLAHGLSLEGLIFKTPDGTIKPWPQKWFFTGPSSDFQWQTSQEGLNQVQIKVYIILALFAALASISISLLLYVQRKTSRRHRQSAEEPEAEGHEEDKSTLLGAENQETEEKE